MSKHKHKLAGSSQNFAEVVGKKGVSRASGPTRSMHEEIAERAYGFYLEQGCPEGHELQHWLAAEAIVRASRAGT